MSEDIKVYREQEDKSWKEVAAQSPVIEHLAEQGLEIDNEQLDAAINDILKSPEIDAMLENVAADAAEDKAIASLGVDAISATNQFIVDSKLNGVYSRIEALEKRVAAAFKHAGFKF
jgi:hypothetical protein